MAQPEFWIDIVNFDNYMVSSFGGVRNWKSGLELKPRLTPERGAYVYLYRDGRNHTKFIHILMAEAFFNSWEYDCVVEHIDGDLLQNNLWNLRLIKPQWTSSQQGSSLNYAKGRIAKKGDIRIVETGETFATMTACAKHIGGQVSGVSECLSGASNRKVYKGCSFEVV